ncbi:hypothetical protein [Ornithinimicrobium kibberense]|uniref:hypothetical protein n=1 Tax=Ornithinimicrobium kibberense TaxID=282060 RepID=UPI003608CFBC
MKPCVQATEPNEIGAPPWRLAPAVGPVVPTAVTPGWAAAQSAGESRGAEPSVRPRSRATPGSMTRTS